MGEGSLRLGGLGSSGLIRLDDIPIADFDTFNVGFTGDEGTELHLGVSVDVGTDDEYVGATFDATGTWERADLMAVPLTTWTDVGETQYASFADYATAHSDAYVYITSVGATTVSESQDVHIDDLHVSSKYMFDGTLTVELEASPASLSTQVSDAAIELGRGVTLTGQLLDGSATAVVGEPVSLFRAVPDTYPDQRIGVFSTDAIGEFSVRRFPRRTGTYYAYVEEEYSAVEVHPFPGTSTEEIEVLPNLRAHVVDRRIRRGERLVVTGSIAPRLAGTTVKLRQADHRRPLTSATVRAHGLFTLRAPLPVGQHSVWVNTPGGEGLIADRTTTRSVTVRP